MKKFRKFDEVVIGDLFERVVLTLRDTMLENGVRRLRYKNLTVIASKHVGLAFSDGKGEVLFLNDMTAIMDEQMVDTSVGEIEASLYSLQRQMI